MKRNEFFQSILAGIIAGLIVGASSIILTSCAYENTNCHMNILFPQLGFLSLYSMALFVMMIIFFSIIEKMKRKIK